MNILFLNITLNWVFKLYKEYILSIKDFIEKYYIDKNIHIEILFIESDDINKMNKFKTDEYNEDNESNNYLKIHDYDKVFYTGTIEMLNILIKKFDESSISKLYFFNIEQMSHPSYYTMIRRIDNLINIVDYSEENIPFFEGIYKNIYLIPPYFDTFNKIINCDSSINKTNISPTLKTIDLLSLINNKYRESIISKIKITKKQKICLLKNCFGNIRNECYNKTKIYINVHCSEEHKTMEMIRIVNLIMNRVIILTQPSICSDIIFLKKYLFICNDPDDFTLEIQNILNNYDLYYNKIYGDFNPDIYINYLISCYDKLIKDLFE